MSDLINREDAVKTIIRMCAPICDATNDLVAEINALPSAELPKGELISRADAIAYIERVINSGLGRNKSLNYIHKYISALPSADAVQIHNDGTLEIKVPNAHKVGRVLVMDTDSHIGGGLFYPDDAVQGFRGGKIPPKEMLDGTVLIPKHQWLEMERELAELKSKFESADAVQSDECDHCVHKWGLKGGAE